MSLSILRKKDTTPFKVSGIKFKKHWKKVDSKREILSGILYKIKWEIPSVPYMVSLRRLTTGKKRQEI